MNRAFSRLTAASAVAYLVIASSSADGQPPPPPPPLGEATLAPAILVSSPIGALSNVDPLTDPNTLFIFPNEAKELPLTIRSLLFQGDMDLAVTCCFDPLTRASVTPAGVNVFFSNQPNALGQSESISALVAVSTSAAPTAGSFLIRVTASNAAQQIRNDAFFLLTVLARPADAGSTCSRFTTPRAIEVVPVVSLTRQLFSLKEMTPTKVSFTAGVKALKTQNGWTMLIEKQPGILPTNAVIVFTNTTNLDKEIVPFDTRTCAPTPTTRSFTVMAGESVAMSISPTTTTTLLLRRRMCRFEFIGCWDYGWDDVAIFSVPPFWTLFGGHKVTINWFFSK